MGFRSAGLISRVVSRLRCLPVSTMSGSSCSVQSARASFPLDRRIETISSRLTCVVATGTAPHVMVRPMCVFARRADGIGRSVSLAICFCLPCQAALRWPVQVRAVLPTVPGLSAGVSYREVTCGRAGFVTLCWQARRDRAPTPATARMPPYDLVRPVAPHCVRVGLGHHVLVRACERGVRPADPMTSGTDDGWPRGDQIGTQDRDPHQPAA